MLRNQTRTYPRYKTTDELIYEDFYSKVCDVSTGTFWARKDSHGNIIPKKDGRPNCDYYVSTIIRLRTMSGDEFLYSQGNIIGYDAAGQECRLFISKPEAYLMTLFDMHRVYDNETKIFYETCRDPMETYDEYELPFSPKNVQLLYEKRNRSRNAKPIQFIVKDEQTGMDVVVRWSSVEDTLKLFKEKDFLYLYNGNYIPQPVKEEMRIRAQALTGGEQQNMGPATNPATNVNYHSNSNKEINAYC